MSVEKQQSPFVAATSSSASMLNHLLSTPSPYHHAQPPLAPNHVPPAPPQQMREGGTGGSPMTNGGGTMMAGHQQSAVPPQPPNRPGQPPLQQVMSGVVHKHPNVAAIQQQWHPQQSQIAGTNGGAETRRSPISPSTSSASQQPPPPPNPYASAGPPPHGSLPPRPPYHPQQAYYQQNYGPRPSDSLPPSHMYPGGGSGAYHPGPPPPGSMPPQHYGYWPQPQVRPPPQYVPSYPPNGAPPQHRMMMMNGPSPQQQMSMPTPPTSTLPPQRSDSSPMSSNVGTPKAAKMNGPKEIESHPSTPSGVQSPGGESSIQDDMMDQSNISSPSWPHTPGQAKTPQQMASGGAGDTAGGSVASPSKASSKDSKDANIFDRLLGSSTDFHPAVYNQRRQFYDRLVKYWESKAQPITAPPTVSKQPVDLHTLYADVMARGGFEAVTRQKMWKDLCPTAVNGMAVSSAAGYQLRRHYVKYLLELECLESGGDPQELIAMAEKQKKNKKKKSDRETAETPPAAAGIPPYQPTPQGPPAMPPGMSPYGMEGNGPPYQMPPPHGYPTMMPHQPYPPHHRPPPPSQWPSAQPPPVTSISHPGQPGPLPPNVRHSSKSQSSPAPPSSGKGGNKTATVVASTVPPPQPQSSSEGAIIARDPFDDRSNTAASTSIHAQLNPQYGRLPPPSTAAAQQQQQHYSVSTQQQHQTVAPMFSTVAGGGRQPPPPTQYRNSGPPGEQPNAHGLNTANADSSDGSSEAAKLKPPISTSQQQLKSANSISNSYQHGPPPSVVSSQLYRPPIRPPQMYPTPGGGYSPYQQPPGPPPSAAQSSGQPPPGYEHYPYQQPTSTSTNNQQQLSQPPTPAQQPFPGYAQWPAQNAVQRQYAAAQQPQLNSAQPSSQGIYSPRSLNKGVPVYAGAPYYGQQQQVTVGGASAYAVPGVHRHHSMVAPTPQPGGFSAAHQRQQVVFPPNSVEATMPLQQKRHRVMARDLPKVDAWRLVMSLKSQLDIESHWALNVLNILLYDDAAVRFFGLKTLPGLLNVLVNHLETTVTLLFPEVVQKGECSSKADEQCHDSSSSSSSCSNKDTDMTEDVKESDRDVQVKIEATDTQIDLNKFTRDCRRRVKFISAEKPFKLKRYLDEMKAEDLLPTMNCVRPTSTPPRRKKLKLELVDEETAECSTEKAAVGSDDCPFYFRECSTKEREELLNSEIELPSRAPVVTFKSGVDAAATKQSQIEYLLSVSNVLRGLAFVPGNEAEMVAHTELLSLYSRLLMVMHKHCCKNGDKPTSQHTELDAVAEEEGTQSVMYEAAVQLREDALVIICLLSAHIDLYEVEECVSLPMCTGLLHWATCEGAEATDNLPHSPVSPRHYALEALCKMSVLEKNVDLLLATPPWPRLERFIETLVDMLSLAEETHCREFAIVLVNALCNASIALSTVTALRTPAVHYIVSFLNYVDANMHTVCQQQGMQILRDNPELMGTSVGMLRRAAGVLQCLSRVDVCRPKFARHQQRLLQLTMSQLMDSRVAGIIADTLFELHCPLDGAVVRGNTRRRRPYTTC